MLNKFDFKLVFEADKFVLSKDGMFVGKCYTCERLFHPNIIAISNKNIISAYMIR